MSSYTTPLLPFAHEIPLAVNLNLSKVHYQRFKVADQQIPQDTRHPLRPKYIAHIAEPEACFV